MKEAIEQFRTQLGRQLIPSDTNGDRWRVPMPPRHCCERPLRGPTPATELVRTAHRFIQHRPKAGRKLNPMMYRSEWTRTIAQPRSSGARSVIALTTALAWKPSSSGTSAVLRWIQYAFKPVDAAPLMSQEFAEMNPSSGFVTFMRSGPRLYTWGLTLKILTSSTLGPVFS